MDMTSRTKRIWYTVALCMAIVFLPWYIYLPMLCVGTFVFRNYVEAVIFAVVADMLFGFDDGSFFNIGYFTTLVVGIVFLLSIVFRDKLRFTKD